MRTLACCFMRDCAVFAAQNAGVASVRRLPGGRSEKERGFTLMELAIVLLIIALIAGGILVGREMIESAKTRKILSEKETFESGVTIFQTKYSSLPGDMPDATAYWGDGCAVNTTTPKTETCNGNGDRLVGVNGEFLDQGREQLTFWQHMANAGVIPGKYANYKAGAYHGGCGNIGISIPQSAVIPAAGWQFWNPNKQAGSNGNDLLGWPRPERIFKNIISLATCTQSPGDGLSGPSVTPKQALYIDGKIDDGIASSGNVFTFPDHADCYVSWVASADYKLNHGGVACSISFMLTNF